MRSFLPSRWFQLSLRTFFVLVGLIALAAGWFGSAYRAQQREQLAFRAITSKGGTIFAYPKSASVTFQSMFLLCPTSNPDVKQHTGYARVQFGDADLHLLDHVRGLFSVSFTRTQVTVQGARQFQRTHPRIQVSHPDFPESKYDPLKSPETNPDLPELNPQFFEEPTETKDI